MWSNQENRVRKQVKNSCEVVAYAMRSRYGFWQVHFGHIILYMRHFSNVIIDIHGDLSTKGNFKREHGLSGFRYTWNRS